MTHGALNLWLHVAAFALYLGATVALSLICLPLVQGAASAAERRRLLAAVMRVYDPFSIGVLGVLVMTGAFNLTGYKAATGPAFFSRIGAVLAWKLLGAFVLINLAAYIAFGIGHRVVRLDAAGEPPDAAWVDAMLQRLRAALWLAVGLTAAILWIALRMTHAGLPAV
jgi:uncharacterized membrane protein